MIKIFFINNAGGGFADTLEVAENTTITSLFEKEMKNSDFSNYLIRVNRQSAVVKDYVLQNGDTVSITPLKIEGMR